MHAATTDLVALAHRAGDHGLVLTLELFPPGAETRVCVTFSGHTEDADPITAYTSGDDDLEDALQDAVSWLDHQDAVAADPTLDHAHPSHDQ